MYYELYYYQKLSNKLMVFTQQQCRCPQKWPSKQKKLSKNENLICRIIVWRHSKEQHESPKGNLAMALFLDDYFNVTRFYTLYVN